MGSLSFAGVDWASRKHALCVVDERGEILESRFYNHTRSGIEKLISRMEALAVCRAAIERPDGLLVDRMIEAGLTVMPVNAGALVATRPRFMITGAKSDSIDAFCLAELARTDSHRYRSLRPDSDATRTLQVLTRAREDLVGVKVGLTNQLRANLDGFWPGAAGVFRSIDSQISLAFLRRYPSPVELSEETMAQFLDEHDYRRQSKRSPQYLLDRLYSAPAGNIGAEETGGRRAAVLGLVTLLQGVTAQIKELTARISAATQAHPDGKIFLPLFSGPDTVLTPALLIAEIGDDRGRYRDSEALAAKAGMVPMVRGSGERKLVSFRYACNRRLQGAVANLANATRRTNPWAMEVYRSARGRGHRHNHALRVLGRAWLHVLWRCWQDEVPYDPAKHGAFARLQIDEEPLLTLQQAADLLGRSCQTVRPLIDSGELEGEKLPNSNSWRIPLPAVLALKERRDAAASHAGELSPT